MIRSLVHTARKVTPGATPYRMAGQTQAARLLSDELEQLEKRKAVLQRRLDELEAASGDRRVVTVLGAGLSSTVLIDYLAEWARDKAVELRVGDRDHALAERKSQAYPHVIPFGFDLDGTTTALEAAVKGSDLVISMVPAMFHGQVADMCVHHSKDMLTASYTSPEVHALDEKAREKGVMILMECGVDPGIDHMATMEVLDRIRSQGSRMIGFETFTGGLVAPESDNNPWGYKFSWNPRNVVLAGQGTSRFLQNGRLKLIPYHKLFSRWEELEVPGLGKFEGYANRDSLLYRKLYGLEDCPTVFRGTLRRPGFCSAWDVLVQLGMTDDTYYIDDLEHMTYRDFLNTFLFYRADDSVALKLACLLQKPIESPEIRKIQWLGLFEDRSIGLKRATPAQVLQKLLEEKWALGPSERDMIVMYHKYIYEDTEGRVHDLRTSMSIVGDDARTTAMAKTVGLPVALFAKRMVTGEVHMPGVHQPVVPELYHPVLRELEEDHGVKFSEVDSIGTSLLDY